MKNIYDITRDFINKYYYFQPLIATAVGYKRFDHLIGDISPAGYRKELKLLTQYKNYENELRSKINKKDFTPYDEIAHDVLYNFIDVRYKYLSEQLYYYELNESASPWQELLHALDIMNIGYTKLNKKYEKRMSLVPEWLRGYKELLEEGISLKKVVSKRQTFELIKQLKYYLITPDKWFKYLSTELKNNIKAAVKSLIKFLINKYYRVASNVDGVGLNRYINYVRLFVGHTLDRDELIKLYNKGYTEINTIITEINNLLQKDNPNYKGNYLNEIKKLKNEKKYIKRNMDDFFSFIKQTLNMAVSKLSGKYFKIPDGMKKLKLKESPLDMIGASYFEPSKDKNRPGIIYYKFVDDKHINVMDEVSTAFHEGFPGHHLHLSTIRSNKKLSDIANTYTFSAISEGWALYAERLMDELGFYNMSPINDIVYKLGMLIMSLYRACRVVIDIGLHLELKIPKDFPFYPGKVWNFKRGKEMLMTFIGQSSAAAHSDMLRYSGWPGQAICYKYGEWEILKLRRKVKQWCKSNNKEFDLKKFHENLLTLSSTSIPFIKKNIIKWWTKL